MESVDTVGARIRGARTRKNMTQRELARTCYVQQATICRWEAEETDPDAFDLINLARALGTQVTDLIPGHPAPARADLIAIATDLKRLTQAVTSTLGNNTPALSWFTAAARSCPHSPIAHWHLYLRTSKDDRPLGDTCFRFQSDALTWGRTHLHELDEINASPRPQTPDTPQ